MKDLPARRVYRFDEMKHPGTFTLLGDERMIFRCPCGCGVIGVVIFKPGPFDPPDMKRWTLTGTKEKPTIKPSISVTSRLMEWHGTLTNGVFKSRQG